MRMVWGIVLGAVCATIAVVVLVPWRVRCTAAWSLFDGKVGIRLSICGLPLLRVWLDLVGNRLALNGHYRALSAVAETRGDVWSKLRVARRGLAAFASVANQTYRHGELRLLSGPNDPAYRWVPQALGDLFSLPRTALRVYAADEQTFKGTLDCRFGIALWRLWRPLLAIIRAD